MSAQLLAADASNAYVKVVKADVPVYLQSGEFYQSLNADETEAEIEVPANSLKPTNTVANAQDLTHLLFSLRFWVVPDPQLTIIDFVLSAKSVDVLKVLTEFETNFPYLSTLHALSVDANKADYDTTDRCALLGDAEMVRVLYTRGEPFTKYTARQAARSGKVECLKYVVEHLVHIEPKLLKHEELFKEAIKCKSLPCVVYLHSINNEPHETACRWAASVDALDILTFLHENNYPWHATILWAAEAGSMRCLQYAHNHGSPWNAGAFVEAAKLKSMEMLEYLHDNGCPWDEQALSIAAGIADIAFVSYLCQKGCPVRHLSMMRAAQNGYVEHLRCLHAHGGVLDDFLTQSAAMNNQLECLKYLHEQGCPIGEEAYTKAVMCNATECVQYLLEIGFAPEKKRKVT